MDGMGAPVAMRVLVDTFHLLFARNEPFQHLVSEDEEIEKVDGHSKPSLSAGDSERAYDRKRRGFWCHLINTSHSLPTNWYIQIALIALVRPITLNFTEPMVFLLNLYIALIYGLLYIWFESFPIIFVGIYKFNLGQEGLAFVGILLGAVLVVPPFFYYLYKVVEPQFNNNGEIKPEKRLPPAFVGAFCIPICLFWFGWSARPSIHWIMPIIGSGFFSVGTFLLFQSVLNYLPDAYPGYAASVLAGNDFMRSSFGAGFPLFATGMYHNLEVGWASSTLGFLSVAFIPIPFVLYRVSFLLVPFPLAYPSRMQENLDILADVGNLTVRGDVTETEQACSARLLVDYIHGGTQ